MINHPGGREPYNVIILAELAEKRMGFRGEFLLNIQALF
jgi:hypothetical protein